MTIQKPGEESAVIPPVVTPPKTEEGGQDIDFGKELESLENEGAPVTPPAASPKAKTPEEERRQAEYTIKHAGKRLKELGGDPAAILADGEPAARAETPLDTSRFVTKEDLAWQRAREMSRSEGEAKVIMWYVSNKNVSVEDAHILANKGRIRKTLSEMTRARDTVASKGGGGAGQAEVAADKSEPAPLDADTVQKLRASGMMYDPTQKAYVGKRSKLQWNGTEWVSQRIK